MSCSLERLMRWGDREQRVGWAGLEQAGLEQDGLEQDGLEQNGLEQDRDGTLV